jgi:hypoxanthine phosphoribosyltransferase
VLLVDDVSVSGATFKLARELLMGATIATLACKGKADFVLFPEVAACVNWPWSLA